MKNLGADFTWEGYASCAQAGDKAAYNRLLKEISVYCSKRLSPRLSDPNWCEDITQEILISVHKSLYTYESERPFLPWLNAIIHFRQTDYLRKHYKTRDLKQESLQETRNLQSGVTYSPHQGELKDIEAALGQLSAQHQEIFKMIKIHGYSIKEVSAVKKMSESAVKVTIHRASKKLQNFLEAQ